MNCFTKSKRRCIGFILVVTKMIKDFQKTSTKSFDEMKVRIALFMSDGYDQMNPLHEYCLGFFLISWRSFSAKTIKMMK